MMTTPTKSAVLFEKIGHHRVTPFALHHLLDNLHVDNINDGFTFAMTNLLTTFNLRSALTQRPAVVNLFPAVFPTGVALSLLFLATQVLPRGADMRLV